MAFASKKFIPTGREDVAEIAETFSGDEAQALEHGGTGVAATGATDADKAEDVLETWGVVDSNGDVPLSRMIEMTAATSGSAGTAGIVPAPQAGDQFRPLCGDGDYRQEVAITKVVDGVGTIAGLSVASLKDNAGVAVLDVGVVGTGENRFQVTATSAATKRSRLTCVSSEAQVDAQIEPKGAVSRVSAGGDPLLAFGRSCKRIVAQSGIAAFTADGLAAPTIVTPGAAVASAVDANGYYVTVTYDGATSASASVSVPSCIQQRHEPDFHAIWKAALASAPNAARLWIGMFNADPGGFDDLGAAGIRGVGIRLNVNSDPNSYQFVTSDGTTQTVTDTLYVPSANAIQRVRIRFISVPVGWECSFLNPSTFAYDNITTIATTVPGASQSLGLWASHSAAASTGDLALSLKTMGVYSL
jgi:hypothetical protein